MNQNIKIFTTVSEIDKEQWQQLVAHSATSSFFQTLECFSFYASTGFLEPFVFGVSEGNSLVGIMSGYCVADGNAIKRFFSRRAIIPGGLLLDKDISNEALHQLLQVAKLNLCSKVIYIEIRNYNDYSSFRPIFDAEKFDYQSHLNFHVGITNVEAAFNKLSSSKRRQIRQSEKAGAYYHETMDVDDLKAFYSILKNLHSTKIKTPLFPLIFFKTLIKNQQAKFIVVKKDDVVIGGIVCVILTDKTVYEWFVCGSDVNDANIYPSVVATWAGIEYAALNGFSRFDFMGAGKPDKSYGVREFKSKFGGELVENGRFLYICNPLLYKIGKKSVELLKKGSYGK
jgi:predicted N-acyltransferase